MLHIPEPDRLIKTATGEQAPIWAPGHSVYPIGVPCERLAHIPTGHIPQLDGVIEAPTGQRAPIWGKGQRKYPVGMLSEHPHIACRLCPRLFPHPNAPIEAAAGEHAPIGTPGQRVYRAAVAAERLQVRAARSIPEADGTSISAPGPQPSIGGKRQALDTANMPTRPEQGTALQIPQLDSTIPAPRGERVPIRAESECTNCTSMRLPGQV